MPKMLVTFNDEDRQRLDEMAAEMDIPRSQVIRYAIRHLHRTGWWSQPLFSATPTEPASPIDLKPRKGRKGRTP